MSSFEVYIGAAVRDAIAAHVAEQEPGREATGRLVVSTLDGRATQYLPIPNRAVGLGRATFGASWKREAGCLSILVHSHPNGNPTPSDVDLAYAASGSGYRRLFAIVAAGAVHIYRLTDREAKTYEPVRVLTEIET